MIDSTYPCYEVLQEVTIIGGSGRAFIVRIAESSTDGACYWTSSHVCHDGTWFGPCDTPSSAVRRARAYFAEL